MTKIVKSLSDLKEFDSFDDAHPVVVSLSFLRLLTEKKFSPVVNDDTILYDAKLLDIENREACLEDSNNCYVITN